MILQNIMFPKVGMCIEEPLFFSRDNDTKYNRVSDVISCKEDSTVKFDTYFNGFSIEKWAKYTTIDNLSLRIKFEGEFLVTLVRNEWDFGVNSIVLSDTIISSDTVTECVLPFSFESTAGIFCFYIKALKDESKFYGGCYETEVAEEKIRPVKIGIDICTFKRENFIYNNIQTLREIFLENQESDLYDKLEVFLVDNAQTIDENKLKSQKVHLYKNINTGGSGGFTRGMIEILKSKESLGITHCLLMDDDIVICPESIFRTVKIYSIIKEQYRDAFIGGAMLRLDIPFFQHEAGAMWNLGRVAANKIGNKLLTTDSCLYNEIEEKSQYQAWWYCAFPVEKIEEGLALPLFFKGDDVEFGLRNMRHLILLNGICVWHEHFENKYSSSVYYYIFRNRVIVNSIDNIRYTKKQFKRDIRFEMFREMYMLRYKNAELVLRAAADFYKGINWFKNHDGEILHKEIMQKSYKLEHLEDLSVPFSFAEYDTSLKKYDNSKLKRFIRTRTLNGFFLRAKRVVIAPTFKGSPIMFYRAKRAMHYDFMSRKGFITEKSVRKTFKLIFGYIKFWLKTQFCYKKTVKKYQKHGKELMTLEFWNKYLKLDNTQE